MKATTEPHTSQANANTSMTSFGDGLWLDTAPVSILGMKLTSTMAVVHLGNDELLLYSPLAMTDERRAKVEALGTIAHLYAPNTFHHLSIGEWAKAFPDARLHAPAGLAKKRPDLRIDRIHGESPEPAFSGVIDEFPIDGFRLEETTLLYRPTQTLIVADLVHNIGRPTHRWTIFYTKMMGFYDRVAMSRMIRWTSFSDRAAARRSLDRLLEAPFERLVVGHGTPVSSGARDAIATAFDGL